MWAGMELAGAAGFEPAHGGIKSRCLTTWRRPSRRSALKREWGNIKSAYAPCNALWDVILTMLPGLAAIAASCPCRGRYRGCLSRLHPAITPPSRGHGVWRSPVAHLVRDEGVASSNLATPTSEAPSHFLNASTPETAKLRAYPGGFAAPRDAGM